MEDIKEVPCYIRVPEDIKEGWKKDAKKKRMSLNQFIILIMEERQKIQ